MQIRSRTPLYVVASILVALVIFGSFWDYEIANALYVGQAPSDNMFGIVLSYVGVIPTFVGWSFLGASIFYLAKRQVEDAGKRRLLVAFAVLLFMLSFFYSCNTIYISNAHVFEIHFAVADSIGIAVSCAKELMCRPRLRYASGQSAPLRLLRQIPGSSCLGKMLLPQWGF